MPITPHSSYRLSAEARALLKAMAVKWGRISLRAALERIIRDRAAAEGIQPEDNQG